MKKSDVLLGVTALCLVTLAMSLGLTGGFIFDDQQNIVDNAAIHISSLTWQAIETIWSGANQHIGRPLAMLSYAINCLFGSSAWGFKATNLAIHLLNTLLVAFLAKRLLAAGWQPQNNEAPAHSNSMDIWAFGLATAWALHPLQVSTVMYVVQRMEILSFTFTLFALLAYWRARRLQIENLRSWPWLLLTVVCVVIGYGFKETIILVPGYALLLELTLLHFRTAAPRNRRIWQTFYVAGCITALVSLFFLIPHYASDAAFAGRDFTAWQRVLTQLRVLSMYIELSIMPLPSHLHFYYDSFVVSTGWFHPVSTLFGGLFLMTLLGLAVAIYKRRPLLAFGIGWFFIAHLLTSGPISLELVFEHRNYPALLGILLAATDLLRWATQRAPSRMPVLAGAIIISSLCFFTILRAASWGNPLLFATTLAQDNPNSSRASYTLATTYLRLANNDPKSPLFHKGIAELTRCAKLSGTSILAEQALITLAANKKIPLQPIWWDSFLRKLNAGSMGPQENLALKAMWESLIERNSDIDAVQLGKAFEIALKKEPWVDALYIDYATLASQALHNQQLAIQQWQQVLILHRGDLDYARQIAALLVGSRRFQEARGVMDFAEEMEPGLKQSSSWQALRARLRSESSTASGVLGASKTRTLTVDPVDQDTSTDK